MCMSSLGCECLVGQPTTACVWAFLTGYKGVENWNKKFQSERFYFCSMPRRLESLELRIAQILKWKCKFILMDRCLKGPDHETILDTNKVKHMRVYFIYQPSRSHTHLQHAYQWNILPCAYPLYLQPVYAVKNLAEIYMCVRESKPWVRV
jgi:hypothetical protein